MTILRTYPHPDHSSKELSSSLGSSSWITDRSGQAIQHLHYLPYGEDWIAQRNSSWTTPYTFSGKEKDVETGYGYFGARYYDSDLSIWLSVDPMSDKYPHQTNYVYCSNNPIIIVDPNGEDEWEVDQQGYIQKVPNTENVPDVLYVINEDGRMKDNHGNYISRKVDNSTMTQLSRENSLGQSIAQGIGKREEYAGNENSLFNFLADNTNVEWSAVGFDNENGLIIDAIGTSHKNGETTPMTDRLIRYFKHSHPYTLEGRDPNVLHDFTNELWGGNPSDPDIDHKYRSLQNKDPNIISSDIPFTLRFNHENFRY